jgi:hypothetical protein
MTTTDQQAPAPRVNRHRTRRALAATLVVIGGIMGPVAITGLWARSLVNSDDAYVNAVAPLASDPTVQAALEDRVTTAIMNEIDSLDLSSQAESYLVGLGLPQRLANLVAGALAGLNDNLENAVSRAVDAVITDPRFATAWTNINRAAHQALVSVVDGDSKLLDSEGNIALQLQTVIDGVKQRLIANGHSWASLLPSNTTAEWVLVPADKVNSVRDAVNALRRIAIVLVVVELLLIAGAILLASDRWRGVAWTAFGLSAGGIAFLGVLRYAENTVVNNQPGIQHPDAVLSVFHTVTASLVGWLRALVFFGLIVAGIAILAGRGSRARRARAQLVSLRVKMSTPPYAGPVRIAAAVVAAACALTLVFANNLSPSMVGALLLVLLITVVIALVPGAQLPISEPESVPADADTAVLVPAATPVTPLTAPLPTTDQTHPGASDQGEPKP